jgi:hypothetical protein
MWPPILSLLKSRGSSGLYQSGALVLSSASIKAASWAAAIDSGTEPSTGFASVQLVASSGVWAAVFGSGGSPWGGFCWLKVGLGFGDGGGCGPSSMMKSNVGDREEGWGRSEVSSQSEGANE